ncbi:hypothetical protein H6504_02905 [Candidatus Woesearchaeota archaeon]|nr:hypothetical protein [Candidatus Woesearchaeota archaeon]
MDPADYLLKWLRRFLKNKDLILRKIVEMKENRIVYKDKELLTLGFTDLEDVLQEDKDQAIAVAVFNTRNNLEVLLKRWKDLVTYERLTIYFINPQGVENRWIISPHLHNKVADPESLETGIKTMADTVTELTDEEIINLIKQDSIL